MYLLFFLALWVCLHFCLCKYATNVIIPTFYPTIYLCTNFTILNLNWTSNKPITFSQTRNYIKEYCGTFLLPIWWDKWHSLFTLYAMQWSSFWQGQHYNFWDAKKPVKHTGYYMYHPLLTYKNSMFSPYSVFICSVWLS